MPRSEAWALVRRCAAMADTESDRGLIPPNERQAPIERLGKDGAKLWDEVVRDFILRPDELRALSSAAKLSDLIARLESELAKSPLLVPGSRPHMLVANGLIGELRQARVAQASLLRSLKLPDLDDDEEEDAPRLTQAEQNRKNAVRRWQGKRGGNIG